MKNNFRIVQNIHNLTQLWEKVGQVANFQLNDFKYTLSYKEKMQWPNRVWLDKEEVIEREKLQVIYNKLQSLPQKVIFPHWEMKNENHEPAFESVGFKKLFEQTGMSLVLDKDYPIEEGLSYKEVNTSELAVEWSENFSKAFGYYIDPVYLINSFDNPDVAFYLAYNDENVAGTGLIYYTGSVAGIHSVGVIPEMRRKGYANQIMRYLLNVARTKGAELVSLQASDAGKPLYEKLGFSTDFTIKNFILEKYHERK